MFLFILEPCYFNLSKIFAKAIIILICLLIYLNTRPFIQLFKRERYSLHKLGLFFFHLLRLCDYNFILN